MSTEKEFLYRQRDFEKVRTVLYQMTGIKLADNKDSMVYGRLARRLRELRIPTFEQYLAYLHEHEDEKQPFINVLTTNLTSFFREAHHFDVLREYLSQSKGEKRIWCAASSTGEEPYSIAISAVEAYGRFDVPVKIIASDIDSRVLDVARAGVYSINALDNMNASRKKKFFYKGKGANLGKVKVVPELRKLVTFQQINLMDPSWPLKGPMDVIFCRNVMIYFDKETQFKILARLVNLLSADGRYFAGHSESFLNSSNMVNALGGTVYTRK